MLKELIKGSYVPEPLIQNLRKYNCRIFDLNEELFYKKTKLDAAFQRCGMRLSNYVSDIGGKSYRKVAQAIAYVETDPQKYETYKTRNEVEVMFDSYKNFLDAESPCDGRMSLCQFHHHDRLLQAISPIKTG